jgi:hypothetical protein
VEGSIDDSSEEELSRTLRWGTPGVYPPKRERSGRHPGAPPATGAPRSPGRGDAPARWCPLCPGEGSSGEGSEEPAREGSPVGDPGGDLRGGAHWMTHGGRPPCQLLREGAGPGAIRWGNPSRIPPRRGPVGRHPRSDAHGRSSEEPSRGDAPAGGEQGQDGRDLGGGGSEEPAPARRLEGISRGSLRRGRNGYGPGGRTLEGLRGGYPGRGPSLP